MTLTLDLGRAQVPVFVFELDRDVAVLLDEHYNAKALEDMILVINNAARECVLSDLYTAEG